jgi:hypothetical protein
MAEPNGDTSTQDLDRALAEIDADARLTARQRLAARAAATRDWQALNGRPSTIHGRADRTHPGRAFSTSAARALGSGVVRVLLRSLFGGR